MNGSIVGNWEPTRLRFSQKQAADLIPTWQVGHAQPLPNDLKKFAEEGYSANSLIYACIREIATSFGALTPIITRPGPEARTPVRTHPMLDLLGDPNDEQDGIEFAEELITQYQAAGNVYLQKVRKSRSAARQRAFGALAVQELGLIRPDYVTIRPGATRDQDVFVVTIEGVVRAALPRSEVIHIRTPSITNDFYGLSPVALLVYEGSIDAAMNSHLLAFFRNAGVPMGILTTKARTTPQQTEEIKSRFRASLNGFRRWWDVLVLNQDEMTYQPLGMKQSELELNDTRAHVESRICAVFGVPGPLVGARFSANVGSAANYEQNQFQFWSETMVPLGKRIGSALERGLFAELANTRDSNAEFGYDFTQVRALQEDLSRKLREVVRLINTGGVMVSTAYQTVGLPSPPNSDFYIRNGSQARVNADGTIEVIPAASGSGPKPDAPNPLEGAAALSEPLIVKEPRCKGCKKLLARALGPGSELECPRCNDVLVLA